jgi:hypothetical protein
MTAGHLLFQYSPLLQSLLTTLRRGDEKVLRQMIFPCALAKWAKSPVAAKLLEMNGLILLLPELLPPMCIKEY